MTRMINSIISRLRTPIPTADRILEIAAGLLVIVMLVMTAIFYKISPDTVPSHFSFTGEANDFSDKSFYWQISGMFVLFMLINFFAAYYPDKNTVRLPIRSKNMSPRQMMLAGRMCRIINIGLAMLWFSIIFSATTKTLGIDKAFVTIINVTAIMILIIPSIWYGYKMYHC